MTIEKLKTESNKPLLADVLPIACITCDTIAVRASRITPSLTSDRNCKQTFSTAPRPHHPRMPLSPVLPHSDP